MSMRSEMTDIFMSRTGQVSARAAMSTPVAAGATYGTCAAWSPAGRFVFPIALAHRTKSNRPGGRGGTP